jgi:hypothetical protein
VRFIIKVITIGMILIMFIKKIMSDQTTTPQKDHKPDKLKHPKTPAEQGKGNLLPEEQHSTVKPVPDPIPGDKGDFDPEQSKSGGHGG